MSPAERMAGIARIARASRERLGLSRAALAAQIGCLPSLITIVEEGRGIPEGNTAVAVADGLHLPRNEYCDFIHFCRNRMPFTLRFPPRRRTSRDSIASAQSAKSAQSADKKKSRLFVADASLAPRERVIPDSSFIERGED